MADTTANRGYPYPEATDDVKPYLHIQQLAEDVDTDVEAIDTRLTAAEAKIFQPFKPVAWALPGSDSGAIGTSETAVLTLSSHQYEANTLYRVEVTGGLIHSASTTFAAAKIRKTNASGTILIEWPRGPAAGHTNAIEIPFRPRYFQVGNTPVTTVLCFTLTASAGATVTHDDNSTYPRGLFISKAGIDTDWPGAVTLS